MKRALVNDGWKLVVYRGPSVNSRYRLVVSSFEHGPGCLNLTPAIRYDISFIDNTSGTEVFTINGDGCESGAVKKFINAVRGNK